jgi:hypothetical protein
VFATVVQLVLYVPEREDWFERFPQRPPLAVEWAVYESYLQLTGGQRTSVG